MRKKYRLEHDESPKKSSKKIPTIDIVLYVVGGLLIVGAAIALIVHFSKKPSFSPSGGAPAPAPPPGPPPGPPAPPPGPPAPPPGPPAPPPPSGCQPLCDNPSGEYCAPAPSNNIEYFGEDNKSSTGKCTLCRATPDKKCVTDDGKCIPCNIYSAGKGDGSGIHAKSPGLCTKVCGCESDSDCKNDGEICGSDNKCVQGFFGCRDGSGGFGCYNTELNQEGGTSECVSAEKCGSTGDEYSIPYRNSHAKKPGGDGGWYNYKQMLTRNALLNQSPAPKDFFWGCQWASKGCYDSTNCESSLTCGCNENGTITANWNGGWENDTGSCPPCDPRLTHAKECWECSDKIDCVSTNTHGPNLFYTQKSCQDITHCN